MACHTGVVPGAIYHPDHTAHIRNLLKQMVRAGLTGLGLGAVTMIALAAIGAIDDQSLPPVITLALWTAWWALITASVLTMIFALIFWLIYRRRRADLDARGAEAVGELKARMANSRRRDDGASP
jgi:membrane protein implicated in regulation of membrane protease activity